MLYGWLGRRTGRSASQFRGNARGTRHPSPCKALPSGGPGIHRSNPSRDAFLEEDPLAETAFLEDSEESEEEDEEAWLEDLNEMRREVDTIVSQVIHLMQRGDLEKSLKEDVLIVLRALRRSQAAASGDEIDDEEAYLESAASMLHFCRLVLRLSEVASQDR